MTIAWIEFQSRFPLLLCLCVFVLTVEQDAPVVVSESNIALRNRVIRLYLEDRFVL